MIGHQIAQFKILEKLGEGGMGVVYRARDTQLERDVAVKVVCAEAMLDPQRRDRLIREAKAASGLNHPNIITVYEIDKADGVDFIAMEYVRGAALYQSIGPKGMSLAEALAYGVQIADALAAAHAAGIVHRDIKPANIMVNERGLVKVLDFGLAKLIEPLERETSDDRALTLSVLRTEMGVVLGTAAYMSPEQAEGKRVDHRSDIFSFGTVLYEMVTGRRPFEGETRMSTLSAVILKDPTPPREVTPGLPYELEKLILRCLRKEPDRRVQHMDDVKLALEELREESFTGRLVVIPPARREKWRRVVPGVAAGLVFLMALGGLAWWWRNRSTALAGLPVLTRLTADSGLTTDPALSADGKLLAYASDRAGGGNLDIWVQHVAGSGATRLTTDEADDFEPVFSPDGTKIAFRSDREGGGIYVVSPLGGESRKIASHGRRPRFSADGTWIAYWVGNPLGSFLFAGNSKIYVAPAAGGAPRELAPGFAAATHPVWAPDGSWLLFLGSREKSLSVADGLDWWVTPLEGGTPIDTGSRQVFLDRKIRGPVVPGQWMPQGDGLLISALAGDSTNLWRVPISTRNWKIDDPLQRLTTGTTLERQPSLAGDASGALRVVFASLAESTDIWSLPLQANSAGPTGALRRLTEDPANEFQPAVSAAGTKIVFSADRYGNRDIFLKDLVTGQESRLTDSPTNEDLPVFSRDGSKVAYRVYLEAGPRQELWVVPLKGGMPERVCEDCGYPRSWSRDGKSILYLGREPARVSLLDLASGKKTGLVEYEPVRLWSPYFSPDDRWIALIVRDVPDRSQLRLVPVGGGGTPLPQENWIAVTDAASWNDKPHWSPDGRILYFISDRDGFRCIWVQRLDPATKRPQGDARPVYHSHSLRRSLMNMRDGPLDISVASDKVVFPMGERTGNIWMAEWKAP